MKLGIIGPSENEIIPFVEKMHIKQTDSIAMLTFYSGKYNDIEIVALYCGVCKVNAAIAAQVLVDRFHVTHIIVTGVAGAIDHQLKIGDTVILTEVSYHDVADDILTDYHPWMESIYFPCDSNLIQLAKQTAEKSIFSQNIYFGKMVTGEAFINQKGRKLIIDTFHPLCVDMETASVAHVCYANVIPFLAIRSITDTESESGNDNFEHNCESASKNSIYFLEMLLHL